MDRGPPEVQSGPAVQHTGRGGRNNSRIHPNNKYYQSEPDFKELSKLYPEIRPYITLGPGVEWVWTS